MSLIYLEDNFITRGQSMSIIDHYKSNLNSVYNHNLTYPLPINLDKCSNSLIQTITNKITDKCKMFDNNVEIQNLEIVKWPFNSRLNYHIDEDLDDVFASILYLNDNFWGGQTAFDTFQINPKIGRLLIFSNRHYKHSVRRVKFNSRYTLAAWYVNYGGV